MMHALLVALLWNRRRSCAFFFFSFALCSRERKGGTALRARNRIERLMSGHRGHIAHLAAIAAA